MTGGNASKTLRVLIVEDNPDDAALMIGQLKSDGLDFTAGVVDSEPEFIAALMPPPDVILCDHTLPQFSAGRAFEILGERGLRLPMLIVSGTITDELAVQYMQRGASDYVLKDRLRRLGAAVKNAVDRFRLEKEAAEANTRLSQLLDDLDIAELSTDLYGNVLNCNDAAVRLLRYESKEAAMAVRSIAHYVDPQARTALLQLLAERGTLQDYEVQFKRTDGSICWTTGHYHATRDEKGHVTGIQALLIDSTDRERAEREATISRQRLDSALQSAPVVLATLDHDLRITFAGGSVLSRIRIDANQVIGLSARTLFKERPDVIQKFERAAAGEEFEDEGEFGGRYFHTKYSPITEPADGGKGFVVVALDVTARRAAELKADARARQQAALRKLAELALQGPSFTDLLDQAVKLVKEALRVDAASVFEFQPSANTGRRIASVGLTQPHDVVSTATGIPAWVSTHREVRALDELLPSDLVDMPFLVREGIKSLLTAPIRSENRGFGALSASSRTPHSWTDDECQFLELMAQTLWVAIERGRLEDERAELIKRLVEAQEEERRRIAADVHDDAVQVMSAVTMRLHLLEKKLTDAELRSLISKLQFTVRLSIERLRSLLFELSPPALESQGLHAALETLIQEFQREHGIVAQLTCALATEPDPGTGLAIYRIVQEALINVHKHAEAKHLKLTLVEVDGGVRVHIEDDGRGFEPSSGATGAMGHVGLAAMRQRAELAGGWWRIESAAGAGTQIEFWVPSGSSQGEAAAS